MHKCDHISLLSLGCQKPFSILQPIPTDVARPYKIPAPSIAALEKECARGGLQLQAVTAWRVTSSLLMSKLLDWKYAVSFSSYFKLARSLFTWCFCVSSDIIHNTWWPKRFRFCTSTFLEEIIKWTSLACNCMRI